MHLSAHDQRADSGRLVKNIWHQWPPSIDIECLQVLLGGLYGNLIGECRLSSRGCWVLFFFSSPLGPLIFVGLYPNFSQERLASSFSQDRALPMAPAKSGVSSFRLSCYSYHTVYDNSQTSHLWKRYLQE